MRIGLSTCAAFLFWAVAAQSKALAPLICPGGTQLHEHTDTAAKQKVSACASGSGKDAKMNGPYRVFDLKNDGTLKIEGTMADGIAQGQAKEFYPSGRVMAIYTS